MDSDDEQYDDFFNIKHPIVCANGIDLYLKLITERSPYFVYTFKTDFYIELYQKGYDGVKNITKDVDIFSKQKLFIPICTGEIREKYFNIQTWSLVYVNFTYKFIKYYDSNGGQDMKCLKLVMNYLIQELIEKKKRNKQNFHPNGWSLINVKDCPQQEHHHDNAIFVCKFAEYLSRDAPLNFSKEKVRRFCAQLETELSIQRLTRCV